MIKTLQTLAQELTQENEGDDLSVADYQVLSTLINSFPDRVFLKDTQLRFVLCNQAMAERFSEPTPEAMYHKTALDYYDQATAESIQERDTTVLDSGTPLFHHENFIKYLNKNEAWVSTTLIPLRNISGKTIGILGFSRDITKRKQHQQELETQVTQRTKELQETNEELQDANEALQKSMKTLQEAQKQLLIQEKLASLGALTAGISHEIQNPLNFINNYAELFGELLEELKNKISNQKTLYPPDLWGKIESDFENMQHTSKVINRQGKRINRIIKSMLMHSGGSSGELRPTDINSLLDEYLNLSYHGMRAKNLSLNIKIESNYDSSLTLLNVVTPDLGRVFLNLISNALYALEEKSNNSDDDYIPVLTVTTKDLTDVVEIRIKDNGTGIPKKVQAEIFNPFFTTKPSGQGSGLGLFISYEIIVKTHHGKILLNTEVGEFTEFVITLMKSFPAAPL